MCNAILSLVGLKTKGFHSQVGKVECKPKVLEEKISETKSKIIGNGQNLLLVVLCFASLIPMVIGKSLAIQNIDNVNYGICRACLYIGKIFLSVCTTVICPALIIANNSKMRKTIIKEFKESFCISKCFQVTGIND